MQKFRLLFLVLILGGLLSLALWYGRDSGVIDEDYLASQSYQQLQKELEQEQNLRTSDLWQLRKLLQKMVAQDSGDYMHLPVALSLESIPDSEWQKSAGYSFKALGRINFAGIQALFVVLKLPIESGGMELMLATSKKDSLIDFKSIGQQKKTISEHIQSGLMIDISKNIRTKITRTRFYPVEQKNMLIYNIEISDSGHITSFTDVGNG